MLVLRFCFDFWVCICILAQKDGGNNIKNQSGYIKNKLGYINVQTSSKNEKYKIFGKNHSGFVLVKWNRDVVQ